MSFGRSDRLIFGEIYGTSFRATHWLSFRGIITLPFAVILHSLVFISLATNFVSNSVPAITIFASIYIPCFFLALSSLYMTTVTDPGAVPMGAQPLTMEMMEITDDTEGKSLMSSLEQELQTAEEADNLKLEENPIKELPRCEMCDGNYKPPRAHHDRFTGRCIVKFDHYCPWVCNAVGALNHKYFFLFLLYTSILCITAGILLIMRSVRCGYHIGDWARDEMWPDFDYNPTISGCKDPSSTVIIITFILAAWFTIVSVVMLVNQFPTIITGNALVARKKIRRGEAKEKDIGRVRTDFNEMFGGTSNRFELHWLIPLPPPFPMGAKDQILGFRQDSHLVETSDEYQSTLMHIPNAECT